MAEMSVEEIRIRARARRRRMEAEKGASPAATPEPKADNSSLDERLSKSYVGQAVAGVNEGIYGLAGLPVDLMSSAVNAGSTALTGEPLTKEPVGGSAWIKRQLSSTIPPATGETGKDLTRAVGREVGANALPAAGLYARGANLATRAAPAVSGVVDDMARAVYARPGVAAATELGASVGSGVGGEGGEALAGPYGKIVGQLLGGAAGGLGAGRMAGDAIMPRGPSADDLRTSASNMYNGIRASGARMSPRDANALADNAEALARGRGWVRPDGAWNSPRVRQVVQSLRSYGDTGMSFDQFQNVRREIISDAIAKASREGGGPELAILQEIKRSMTDNGASVWRELPAADRLHSTAERHRTLVDRPLEKGRIRGNANYSQAGEPQAAQREFTKLNVQNADGKLRGVPDQELRAIDELSVGTGPYRAARWLGKFAPTSTIPVGGAVGTGTAAGLATGNPIVGALTAGGMMTAGKAGRSIADSLQNMKVNELSELIRTGRYQGPRYMTEIQRAIAAQLAARGFEENPE